MNELLVTEFEDARQELLAYLCRLVVRPQVAEDLVQTTYLRCLEADERLPESREGVRAWLFRVATNLAFDELRRSATRRESMLQDLRLRADASSEFQASSRNLVGTPETKAIAQEHLVACISCTLRNLPERRAAAVLLKEVHGFAINEAAKILDATTAQTKNWLQEGRAYMKARYGETCALITKSGVCHQCVELDGFFAAGAGSPLADRDDLKARFAIAAQFRTRPWGTWHRLMLELVEDLD